LNDQIVDSFSRHEHNKADDHDASPLQNDSFDHCEWENHSFVLISLDRKIPDSCTKLPSEPLFPLIAVTSSQVFHPPSIV
jgi:hypothetical protein